MDAKGATDLHALNVKESLVGFSNLEMRCGMVLSNAQRRFLIVEDLKQHG